MSYSNRTTYNQLRYHQNRYRPQKYGRNSPLIIIIPSIFLIIFVFGIGNSSIFVFIAFFAILGLLFRSSIRGYGRKEHVQHYYTPKYIQNRQVIQNEKTQLTHSVAQNDPKRQFESPLKRPDMVPFFCQSCGVKIDEFAHQTLKEYGQVYCSHCGANLLR